MSTPTLTRRFSPPDKPRQSNKGKGIKNGTLLIFWKVTFITDLDYYHRQQ